MRYQCIFLTFFSFLIVCTNLYAAKPANNESNKIQNHDCERWLELFADTRNGNQAEANNKRAGDEIRRQIISGNPIYIESIGKRIRAVADLIKANHKANYKQIEVLQRFLKMVISIGDPAKPLAADIQYAADILLDVPCAEISTFTIAKETLRIAVLRLGNENRRQAIHKKVEEVLDSVFSLQEKLIQEIATLEPLAEDLEGVIDAIVKKLNAKSERTALLISGIVSDKNRAYLAQKCFASTVVTIRSLLHDWPHIHPVWLRVLEKLIPEKVNDGGLDILRELMLKENPQINFQTLSIAAQLGSRARSLLPEILSIYTRLRTIRDPKAGYVVNTVAKVVENDSSIEPEIKEFLKSGLDIIFDSEMIITVAKVLFKFEGDAAIPLFVNKLEKSRSFGDGADLALAYAIEFPGRLEFLPLMLELKTTVNSYNQAKIKKAIQILKQVPEPVAKPISPKSLERPKILPSKTPRSFARISIKELTKKIESALGKNENYKELSAKVKSDLKKVQFDDENFETEVLEDSSVGYHKLDNGLTYFGVIGSGDWEYGVFFIIYWDGKSLRAYVPQYGNFWNTDTNAAFGNDEEKDNLNIRKRIGEFLFDSALDVNKITRDKIDRNPELLLEDIKKRFNSR